MAEGQTRLMQPVAERRSWGAAGLAEMQGEESWLASAGPRTTSDDARVQQVVRAEVLPRISVAHVRRLSPETFDAPAVDQLVDLLLRPGHEATVNDVVDAGLAQGLSVDHIYLRLFQPSARRLGELWRDDHCSFVDVTLATGTLQAQLRRLAPAFHRHSRLADGSRVVLLTTLPGDQHSFGVNMAAEFFRRSGWDVCAGAWDDAEDLAAAMRVRGCRLAGFSASSPRRLGELASAITGLRRAMGRREIGVLVGGPVFVASPEEALRVGADAVGLDARQAVAQAEALVGRGARI